MVLFTKNTDPTGSLDRLMQQSDSLIPQSPLVAQQYNTGDRPSYNTGTSTGDGSSYPALSNFQEKIGPRLPLYGGVLLACAALYAWGKHRKSKTNVLGKGGLGNKAVLERARKRGLEELGTTLNKTAVWLGDPKSKDCVMLRSALPGVLVEGGPNAGKSYSVFNPLMYSVVQQRMGCVIVDFKYPKQTARIIDYAKTKMGYDVGVIAPSFEETQVLNPIHLLRDHTDTLRAEEFIKVAKENLSKGASQSSSDKFWDDMATQILTGLFCLVSDWQYPDLLMVKSILSLEDLPSRLREAKDRIPPSVYRMFDQLFSAEGSERQMAGLKSSCLQPIDAMTNTAFLSAICGDTTAPLDIGPGKMLVIGLNRNYKKTLGPLLGALIHTVIEANINEQRESPLAFFCDELPGIYLPDIAKWLAEGREDGFLAFLGIQAYSQMVERYGAEPTKTIYTSLPSKTLMNPNNPERAEGMSKWVGQIDVNFDTKGDGSSRQGKSKNYTGHKQAISGFQASEITRLTQGEAMIVSPGFESADRRQSFIPVKKKIVVPDSIQKAIKYSEGQWEEVIRPEMIAANQARAFGDTEIQLRRDYAEQMLPLPPEYQEEQAA